MKNKNEEILIEIKNLSKKFSNLKAVDDITFNIYKGESVVIIGANGAGKTTLSEMLSGVSKPSSGKINYTFGNNKIEIAKNIGIQFQDNSFPNGVGVKDLINFYASIYNVDLNSPDIKETFKIFNMDELMDRPAANMSGGQRQRLNVLLSFLHKPKLLLLDEVSTGLDIKSRNFIRDFLKDIIKGNKITLILVSHNMNEAEFLCDRLILMEKGKIINDQPVKEIVKKFGSLEAYANDYFETMKDTHTNVNKKVGVK